MTMKFNVRLQFESFAIRDAEGKEIFRSLSPNEACAEYDNLVRVWCAYNITATTERALADCEVVTAEHVINCRHMTLYRVYVNGEFVKELMFRPYPLAMIRAIASGLDWKINN